MSGFQHSWQWRRDTVPEGLEGQDGALAPDEISQVAVFMAEKGWRINEKHNQEKAAKRPLMQTASRCKCLSNSTDPKWHASRCPLYQSWKREHENPVKIIAPLSCVIGRLSGRSPSVQLCNRRQQLAG
jgi:hypothetical protein